MRDFRTTDGVKGSRRDENLKEGVGMRICGWLLTDDGNKITESNKTVADG